SPSRYEKIESLSKYQSVNPPSKPLAGLPKVEQDAYLVKLSDDILNAVEEAQAKPAVASGAGRLRTFNVPLPRNKFFIGRDEVLNQLHKNFNGGERTQALNGLGGIGKTQIAVEYAYRYQQDYRIVLWANAGSRKALITDFAAIAGLLNLPEKDAQDQASQGLVALKLNRPQRVAQREKRRARLNLPEKDAQDQGKAVNAVKRWLESHDGWLLILDNADDLAMAREFIPSGETGHVLLTTRAQYLGDIAARNAVKKLEPQE